MKPDLVSIRAAQDEDVLFLREMIWEAIAASPAFLREVGTEVVRRHEDEYWTAWLTRRDPAFIAIRDGGSVLGAIVLKPEELSPLVRGWRFGIAVKPEARRRGVGLLLVRFAIEHARTTGAAYLGLLVDPDNRGAIALYEHSGFTLIGFKGTALEMRIAFEAGSLGP